MTIYPQALLGMIEIDKTTDVLEIVTTGGTVTLTPNRNTYANIIDLVYDLWQEYLGSGYLYLSSEVSDPGHGDFYVKVSDDSNDITSITSGVISSILGGNYAIVDGDIFYTNRPLNSWIPEFRSKDGNWFKVESDSLLKGSIGVSGNLSGISYTPRQKKELEFPFVERENAYSGSGTDAELRSFETVINNARANLLQYPGSNNIQCKGVYYIHTINDYIGSVGKLSGTWDNGKPNKQTYVFCSSSPPGIPGQSDDTRNTHYECSVTLTTGTAPSWNN